VNLFPGSETLTCAPRLGFKHGGVLGGAGLVCFAFDYTTGLQISGQSCNDPTQPSNTVTIHGYFDGMFPNDNQSLTGITWDGSFRYPGTFLSHPGFSATLNNNGMIVQGGPFCGAYCFGTAGNWSVRIFCDLATYAYHQTSGIITGVYAALGGGPATISVTASSKSLLAPTNSNCFPS